MDFNKNRAYLYDTVAISADNAGTQYFNTESQFFTVPKGTSGKTFADTNLLTARQIARGSAFNVKRIMAQVFPGVAPSVYGAPVEAKGVNDLWEVFKKGTLAIQGLNDQVLLRVPLSMVPGSTRLDITNFAYEGIADGAGVGLQTQYATLHGETFDLAEPLAIIGGEAFGAIIEMPSGLAVPSNTVCKIKLLYEGVWAVPKQ